MEEQSPYGVGCAPAIQFNQSVIAGGTYNVFSAKNDVRCLQDIVAFDALLNSQERFPAPHCHPDTRKEALEIVESWIWNMESGFKGIMWISGAPGVGKSAIVQTICETLAGPYNPIHASFFFTRGQGARERAASFPPTIAYQFTVTSIVCRWYIWYLLRNDPGILREAFHSQFQKLVIAPASARSYVQYPMIVAIDGLDECNNAEDRVSLLKLILEAAKSKSIRFLIASRPEEEIETFFKDPDVAPHINHIVLDEESFKTSKDIIVFLRSEFARIRRSRPHSIPAPIDGEEWPGGAVIARLAVYADGQFIYAILTIGFIDNKYFSPHEQLELLLNPPPDIAPFSKLDRLYLQILTRYPPQEQGATRFAHYQNTVKAILRVMVAWPSKLTITQIATVLGEDILAVHTIVRGPLRTLFKFDENVSDSQIVFCHKSLGDSLSDPNRSGDFHVPKNALDILYLDILSRQPPSSRNFYRSQLSAILGTVLKWPAELPEARLDTFLKWPAELEAQRSGNLSLYEISIISGVDRSIVDNILLRGPTSLLFSTNGSDVRIFHDSLGAFLSHPHLSGEFHVPENFVDLTYIRIISGTPHTTPPRTFSQEELIRALHVLMIWPESGLLESTRMKRSDVALLGDVDSDVLEDIVRYRLSGLFFTPVDYRSWPPWERTKLIERPTASLRRFLLDRDRSGEFCVPKNALDLLYFRILSNAPSAAFSRGRLLEFLYTIIAWPRNTRRLPRPGQLAMFPRPADDTTLDKETVALVIGDDPESVRDFASRQPMSLLFPRFHLYRSIESLRDFLLDPHRAGEFHVPPNALDLLYLRILSRPPPQYSRKRLIGLLWDFLDPENGSQPPAETKKIIVSVDLAETIERCPQSVLFEKFGHEFKLIDSSLRTFLMDPSRSGKFCFAESIPDPSTLWPS